MTKPKIGVLIATPVRYWRDMDQFHPDFQKTIARLCELTADPECPYSFDFSVMEGGIVRARNKFAAELLKRGHRWLVFWDDDIPATAEDILRLLSHKRPVVGAPYCRRDDSRLWVANFAFDAKPDDQGLMQVIECGTGLKVYHQQVFTELIRLYPTIEYHCRDTGQKLWGFFQQTVMNGDAPSEDYFLDWLCRQARIGIWWDTKLKLKHRGPDGTLYPQDEWPPIPGLE